MVCNVNDLEFNKKFTHKNIEFDGYEEYPLNELPRLTLYLGKEEACSYIFDSSVEYWNAIDELESLGKKQQVRKDDSEKLRFDLIPTECERILAKVLTYGSSKYSANNWQQVDNPIERYTAALMRHLNEFRENPSAKDSESGFYHIYHVLTNAMFLAWFVYKQSKE